MNDFVREGDGRSNLRTLLGIAVLALLYTAAGKLGISLVAVHRVAALVWAPSGLALAAVLLVGPRLWPGVFLGALIVDVWIGVPPAAAVGMAIGNTLQALLGGYLLRRFGDFRWAFERLRHVLVLVVGAAGVSTLVSATLGVLCLWLGGAVRTWPELAETWRAWWIGDVLGDLVIAPLLLSWARSSELRGSRAARTAEALALATLLGLVCYASFYRPFGPSHTYEPAYLLFPLFVWAALRFELRGASLATASVCALAIGGTAHGLGTFARADLAHSFFAQQTFFGCAALTPLVVAGAMMDRARAIRVQETFVATVSHDLKNPLNTISMSAQALRRRLPEEPVCQHLHVVQRSIDRMLRIIADLLDTSAIEHGQLAVEPKAEDARALLDDALELLRPLASAKGQTLLAEVPEGAEVFCDRERVLQVLSNVIGNAIKFSPEGARIEITVRREPHVVCFAVRDEGPGVEAAEQRHVFERYRHASHASGGGSGLGLFIAKGIVEAHGGQIWLKSRLGAGSTFYFTLRLSETSAAPEGDRARRSSWAAHPQR
jgi:signal transduction histidine kinase